MIEFSFRVPGEVRGKPRPRFSRSGHAFNHPIVDFYEGLVREHAAEAASAAGLEQPALGPMEIAIWAYAAVPASRRRQLHDGDRWLTKPDIDNIAKIVCDALNGVIWKDDTQVSSLSVHKAYGPKDEMVVTIRGSVDRLA